MSSLSDLPLEILETIFKFLPSENLLKASLVCHSWYSVIGTSKKCMPKIQITVKEGKKMQIKRILDQSLRRYENFKIEDPKFFMSLIHDDENSLENIFKSLPHLKSLSIYYLDTNILEIASKFLTKLEKIDTNFITLVIPNNQIKFPHLKKIKFTEFTKITDKKTFSKIGIKTPLNKEVLKSFQLGLM